eukprot:954836-Alexandrium_andersonii.AAC.1
MARRQDTSTGTDHGMHAEEDSPQGRAGSESPRTPANRTAALPRSGAARAGTPRTRRSSTAA